MKFSIAIVATALIAGVTADFATVNTDVQTIQSDVAKLYQALNTTSGNSYSEALAIDKIAKTLVTDINTANKDAGALTALTEAQAKSLVSILNKTYANVSGASQRLIDLEPPFKKLGVVGIAKTDIGNLANSTKTFGATLVEKAPEASKAKASALADKYNNALASGVAAYASD